MKLFIEYGHWFLYEDYNGNACVVTKDDFKGIDADTTKGQGIYYEVGYTWRWENNRRSDVFSTKQQAFDDAFEQLFVLCPNDERTELIEWWQDYARDNNFNDAMIMAELQQPLG